MSKASGSNGSDSSGYVFATSYRHWRSGKIMLASDYGLKAWCFLKKRTK